MSLPHFEEFGWEPTVLAVAPEYVEGEQDPLLLQTVPKNTPVFRAKAIPVEYSRRVGLGSLALRALPFLRKAGDEILRNQDFDLIYFSTTSFPVMVLGRRWLRKFRIPYVVDLQDPWVNEYFKGHKSKTPPGGNLKYGCSQYLARVLEPFVLRRSSHIICVSPDYPKRLLRRYPWLSQDRFTVLPFGVAENDFKLLNLHNVRQKVFDPCDGKRHWVYVGAGGVAMTFSIRSFFKAFSRVRRNGGDQFKNVVVHFVGTDYAAGARARETFRPIAAECGVADAVREIPNRIPYFEALKCLTDAEALIVPGSDDPGYTASKIYPYILANRPMLAIFHQDSTVVDVLRSTNAGVLVTFGDANDTDRIVNEIEAKWFTSPFQQTPATNRNALKPYLAREMTRRQCAVFDQCIERGR